MSTSPPPSASPSLAPEAPSARGRRAGPGFWLVAGAFLTAMAFSTVPTPLYALYERRDGFSSFVVTVVFAVYAVGVVLSLVLAGHLSDWAGRRRVLFGALGLELLAAVLFVLWPQLPGLLVARFVTGLGVGMITATATAHLHELHVASRPAAGPGRFEVVSIAANIGGLGVGPLVAGALAQWVSSPLRTPYVVFAVLLLAALLAVALAPETVTPPPQRPRYRPRRLTADHGDRAGYLAAAASGFVAFAVFGVSASLSPGFVAVSLHHPSRLLAGVAVFVVFGASALAQAATDRLGAQRRADIGLCVEAVGLVVLAEGMRRASLAAFLLGGAAAGAGAGMLFKAAVARVIAMAPPDVRGEALAGLFLVSYLGIIIPALGLGLATRFTSDTDAVGWFAGVLLALIALLAALGRRRR